MTRARSASPPAEIRPQMDVRHYAPRATLRAKSGGGPAVRELTNPQIQARTKREKKRSALRGGSIGGDHDVSPGV